MKYWIHMTAAKADTRKAAFEAEQQKRLPRNRLSVVYNLAGTECVVKVDGDIDKAALTGDVLRIYDKTDHAELYRMMQGKTWQAPDEDVIDVSRT